MSGLVDHRDCDLIFKKDPAENVDEISILPAVKPEPVEIIVNPYSTTIHSSAGASINHDERINADLQNVASLTLIPVSPVYYLDLQEYPTDNHRQGVGYAPNADSNISTPVPDGIKVDDGSFGRCETCNLAFDTKLSRSHHLRYVHGIEKPFKCELCGTRFLHSSSLHNHSRTHSDSKSFECHLCAKVFKWKICLEQHLICTHKTEPGAFRIASKSVWEGKKPPPPLFTNGYIPKKRGRPAKRQSVVYSTSSAPKLPKTASSQQLFFTVSTDLDAVTNINASDAIAIEDFPITATNDQITVRMNAGMIMVTINGHTSNNLYSCGYCEKQFMVWNELGSHVRECAEKQKAASACASVTSGTLDQMVDQDSDIRGDLVIDEGEDMDAPSTSAAMNGRDFKSKGMNY